MTKAQLYVDEADVQERAVLRLGRRLTNEEVEIVAEALDLSLKPMIEQMIEVAIEAAISFTEADRVKRAQDN